MKQTASSPSKHMRNLAHKALKALGFVNLGPLVKASHPSPATLGLKSDLTGDAEPTARGSACRLAIPLEDWDVLFQSVQSRLSKAVGERPASSPSPRADDVPGHLQVLVLECVAALELLRTALKPEHA